MSPGYSSESGPDRLTRYRVLTFVCFLIVAGAWSIAYSQAARIAPWQWETMGALTVFTAIVFFRWFRFARTTTLGVICAAAGIGFMLLVTF